MIVKVIIIIVPGVQWRFMYLRKNEEYNERPFVKGRPIFSVHNNNPGIVIQSKSPRD